MIYDPFRRKYIVLTPEEWVRQHVLHFLTTHLHYPKGLVKVEGGLRYNRLQKRSDILVFDNTGAPLLLVECKAAQVRLTEAVCNQLAAYNMAVGARIVAITNGLDCYTWRFDEPNRCYHSLSAIPEYGVS